MTAKDKPATRTPVLRTFSLPNGEKIISLRESTFRAAVKAANNALKGESSGSGSVRRTTK